MIRNYFYEILIGRKKCLFGLWKSVNDTRRFPMWETFSAFDTRENKSTEQLRGRRKIFVSTRFHLDCASFVCWNVAQFSTLDDKQTFGRSPSLVCLLFSLSIHPKSVRTFDASRGGACFSFLDLWRFNKEGELFVSTRCKMWLVHVIRNSESHVFFFWIYFKWNTLCKCLLSEKISGVVRKFISSFQTSFSRN